jgi:hypothetical protein
MLDNAKNNLSLLTVSAASNSWLVGTVVGHQYGWLRNGSAHAGTRKWIPDLHTGWEYRPLVRTPGELTNTWCTDDGTLRIESLRGELASLLPRGDQNIAGGGKISFCGAAGV